MSLAAETREAVRARPFLYTALRAGVVNYTAAARYLDIGDTEPVAAALRRYAEELPDLEPSGSDPRVEMQSGVGPVDTGEHLLAVGGTTLGADGGDSTAVVAHGVAGVPALERVLGRLRVEEVPVEAAGSDGDVLVLVVPRRQGANALRFAEDALA